MPIHSCRFASGRQRGSSAVEFTLAAIPILLAGLGAIELGRWFFVKQAISLALLEAARAGIVDHAHPASIEAAFEHALLPLFPSPSAHGARQRMQQAFERRQAATGAPPWQIKVIAPQAAVFLDFASPGLKVAGAGGLAAIDNNYQAEQHLRHQQQGWASGRGPLSGATIFEANELALHLSYMHEPLVPGMGALLRLLSPESTGHARQALAGGYLPLRQTLRLAMQSHPVAWPHSGAKVLGASEPAFEAGPPPGTTLACRGIWCERSSPVSSGPHMPAMPGTGSHPPASGLPSTMPPAAEHPVDMPPGAQPPAPDSPGLPPADDIACGTVLCCVTG